jgi:hypothetical protein
MRTTLTIDDAAFSFFKAYANARALKMGEAVSEIAFKMQDMLRLAPSDIGQSPPGMKHIPIRGSSGLWVFDVPPGTPKMTAEEVAALIAKSEQDEDDRSIEFARTGKFPD